MKRSILAIILLFFTFLLGGCGPKDLEGTEGIKYELSSDGNYYIVTGCEELSNPEVIIANKYNNLPVKEIANKAFENNDYITKVVMQSNLIKIGDRAFFDCDLLNKVTISDNIESIGKTAFYNCPMLQFNTSLNGNYIGNSENPYVALIEIKYRDVTKFSLNKSTIMISDRAFMDCENLKKIDFKDNSKLKHIGKEAFYSCDQLESLKFPRSLESIGDWAMFFCRNLTSVTIPDNIKRIGDNAFIGCDSLEFSSYEGGQYLGNEGNPFLVFVQMVDHATSIIIHKNTKIIQASELRNPSLVSLLVDKNNKVFDSRDNCNAIIETKTNKLLVLAKLGFVPNGVEIITKYVFSGEMFKNKIITLPSSVRIIESNAFNNASFSELRFEENSKLEIIEESAFDSSNIKIITIPKNVKIIGSNAFSNSLLVTLNIDEDCQLKKIGNNAFSQCGFLQNITIPKYVEDLGTGVFDSCHQLRQIIVAEGNELYDSRESCNAIIETKTNKLIYGCGNSKIPSSVEIIGERSFYGAGNGDIEEIYIPSGVKIIEENAFEKCIIKKIIIGNTVEEIQDYAFLNASYTNIVEFEPNSSLKRIGKGAFSFTRLYSIKIPASVVTIDDYAFFYIGSLISVIIENDSKLETLGKEVFASCYRLETVVLIPNLKNIGENVFDNPRSIKGIYFYGQAKDVSQLAKHYNFVLGYNKVYYYAETRPQHSDYALYWHYDENGIPTVWSL